MIAATILAAGDSTRMGSPKALLDLHGQTFVKTIISKLAEAGVGVGYLTVGREGQKILQNSDLGDCRVIENEEPSEGPVGSVRSALRVVPPGVDAMLVWPVDQPHVKTETIVSLVTARSDLPIVVPTCAGKRGHPIILRKEVFEEVLLLPSGSTLRNVVRRDITRVCRIEVNDFAIHESIDTPDDYRRLLSQG